MNTFVRAAGFSLTAAATLLLSVSAPAAQADEQRPGPGVARISLIQGDVGVRRDDAGDTVAAVLNAPLLEGDYLSTGDAGSDAELQVDGATLIRLGYGTQLRFSKIESGERVAQVAQGTLEERVMPGGTPIVIDTPSISMRPLGKGAYRIGVADDGSSQITIRSGSADILTPQGTQTVAAGHSVNASGDAAKPSVEVVDEIPKDDFDAFNDARDGAVQKNLSERNLPPDLADDDYARYGQWVDDPSYGQVWAPTVDPGWTPYSDGRWVWEGGYGWTWIAAEPWGWAPYHYGRWFRSAAYGWCWYPPQPAVAHVWSPALVAFVGFGGGSGVSVGFGSVGWVPLGPGEPFYPWYGWSGGVFGARTVVNTVTVTNITYVNRRFGHLVPVDRWQAGDFAHPARIASADWAGAQAVHGALPVVPTRANLRYGNKPVPSRLAEKPVVRPRFAALAPPAKSASFEQVRSALQAHSTGETRPAPAAQGNAWDRFDRAREPGTPPVNGSYGRQQPAGEYRAPGSYHAPVPARRGKPAQKKDDKTKKT